MSSDLHERSANLCEAFSRPNDSDRPVVIIVSPYFPPSSLAGVHRARFLAKYLPFAGWDAAVVCVDERYYNQPIDVEIGALVPEAVQTYKVAAVSSRIARVIGIGDVGLRGWFELRREVKRLVELRRRSLVFISGSPFYPMMMAPELCAMRVPVVLDFQDPWVSAWGEAQPVLSKAGLAHWIGRQLEPRALRGAKFITSVSAQQNADMAVRYPWLDVGNMAALPIGGDPEDFEFLHTNCISLPEGTLDPSRLNLSFVGTFMPRSGPLVEVLLKAFAKLRCEVPAIANRIRLNFIGTSNQPGNNTNYQVSALARAIGVADVVKEIPQRLPFLQALTVLVRSDGILLIGSDEPHYTASKIYPALMSGRPFLSIFHARSSAHKILSAAGGGLTHAYLADADQTCLVDNVASSLRRIAEKPDSLGLVDPSAYAPFDARAIAAAFARIFDEIISKDRS